MPDAKTHSALTRAALRLQRFDTGDNEKLIGDYSSWPDFYFSGRRNEIAPYMFFLDGIQFHYPPNTPYAELYRYWDNGENGFFRSRPFVNENHRHVTEGFRFYIGHAVRCFEKKEMEEGKKYLGCLLHMLEDSCFGFHAMEGAGGSDGFVLDRMTDFPVPPSTIIAGLKYRDDFPALDYVPHSLGNSPEEMVMKLYAAYCAASSDSRKSCFLCVINTMNGCPEKNREQEIRMYANTVKLCADAICTVFQIARGEIVESGPCRLEELEPYEFPFGGFGSYLYRSFARDCAYGRSNERIPLELDSGRVEHGLSFGTHAEGNLRCFIAPKVFRRFTCRIGFHPLSPVNGTAEITWFNDGKSVRTDVLDKTVRELEIEIADPGRDFGLSFRSVPGCGILVLAEPLLQR